MTEAAENHARTAAEMAQRQGLSSTVHGDPTGETAKLRFIRNDHLSRRGVWSRRHGCDCFQPAFGVAQALLHTRELATLQ